MSHFGVGPTCPAMNNQKLPRESGGVLLFVFRMGLRRPRGYVRDFPIRYACRPGGFLVFHDGNRVVSEFGVENEFNCLPLGSVADVQGKFALLEYPKNATHPPFRRVRCRKYDFPESGGDDFGTVQKSEEPADESVQERKRSRAVEIRLFRTGSRYQIQERGGSSGVFHMGRKSV